MNKRFDQLENILLQILSIAYMGVLFKILFYSRLGQMTDQQPFYSTYERVNFIPFHTISDFIFAKEPGLALGNVLGNVLLFIPMGIFLSLHRPSKSGLKHFLMVILTSSLVEVLQGIFRIGVFDIDDILLNSLGGLIGILIYKLLKYTFKEKSAKSIAILVSSIVGAPIFYILLFHIKMIF